MRHNRHEVRDTYKRHEVRDTYVSLCVALVSGVDLRVGVSTLRFTLST